MLGGLGCAMRTTCTVHSMHLPSSTSLAAVPFIASRSSTIHLHGSLLLCNLSCSAIRYLWQKQCHGDKIKHVHPVRHLHSRRFPMWPHKLRPERATASLCGR